MADVISIKERLTDLLMGVESFVAPGSKVIYNKEFAQTKLNLVQSIRGTKKSLKIAAGEVHREVYTDEVVSALTDLAGGGGKIQMVCGPAIDEDSKGILRDLLTKRVVELYVPTERVQRHFRIHDRNFLFLEAPHEPKASSKERRCVGTDIKMHIQHCNKLFDRMQKRPVTPENFEATFKFI